MGLEGFSIPFATLGLSILPSSPSFLLLLLLRYRRYYALNYTSPEYLILKDSRGCVDTSHKELIVTGFQASVREVFGFLEVTTELPGLSLFTCSTHVSTRQT